MALIIVVCLLLCIGVNGDHGRGLRQSVGASMPLSATPGNLVNDPQGKGFLLKALGDSENYQARYDYSFTSDHLNVDPTTDPGPGVPDNANASTTGSWVVLGNAGSVAVHAIPFTNELILFMQRTDNRNGTGFVPDLEVLNGTATEISAIYNMSDNTFKPYHITEHPFCAGHTLMPDGNAIIVGGDSININAPFLTNGLQAIRIFDPVGQNYSVVGTMDRGRYYPSVLTMADGNLLILGGSQQEAGGFVASELPSTTQNPMVTCATGIAGGPADPTYDNPSYSIFNTHDYSQSPSLALTILMQAWPISLYPYATVMPSGSVLVVAGTHMQAMFLTPEGAILDSAIGTLPSLPIPVNFPYYNSFALLPLQGPDYKTQVLMAGGVGEYCSNPSTPAGETSFLVDVTPGANHTVQEEALAFPRVMGDLVVLPDGTVFLTNGAKVGIAGGSGPNGATQDLGTTTAEIYNPAAPMSQRWTTVADSGIWRMYHSWAFLTSNATVIVGGSDPTAERRLQIYTPAYLQNGKPRPVISSSPPTLGYGASADISFSGVPTIDSMVIHRVTSVTHGNHFDARQVVLDCSPASGQSISCNGPPNSSIAPPGFYMLFAVTNGVPSRAPYIQLPDSQAGANSSPATTG